MKKKWVCLVMVGLIAPSIALAEEISPISANIGFASDYVFRGISQTSHNPAVQGGVDYANAKGYYAGIWGSNVSWIADSGAVATGSGSVTMELDTYAGLRGSLVGDLSYDIGYIRYNYPGTYTAAAGFSKADTEEVYGALGYKWLTAKYSYGLGQFLTIPRAAGTNYLELNASVPVADTGVVLVAHIGKQTYQGSVAAANAAGSLTYSDYRLGVTKDFSGYVAGLFYTGTNATAAYTYANFNGDWARSTTVLSVTHAF